MKTNFVLGAVAAAAVAVFSQGAFAQASSPTRAEVKAEAKGATKAPTGEAQTMSKQPSTMSEQYSPWTASGRDCVPLGNCRSRILKAGRLSRSRWN